MTALVHNSFGSGLLAFLALLLTTASARGAEEPPVRDHRTQPIVRDHRGNVDPALVTALSKATNAALNGPGIKGLKVNGHEFNVKTATLAQAGGTVMIHGQISHVLTARPDDQIYYTIQKTGDQVTLDKFGIKRGGVASVVPYPVKLIKNVFHLNGISSSLRGMLSSLGDLDGGPWESSAELIVASVGISAKPWVPSGSPKPETTTTTTVKPDGTIVRDHRGQ